MGSAPRAAGCIERIVTPEAEARRRALVARKGFSPDGFQIEAFDVVDTGDSVLVAAPTSSGKTLVAEYAIERALAEGRRVAYTTPIKALSNQKMRELTAWLGRDRVGLLTGDNSIRGDAAVVVMTTEVLRNMIYAGSDFLDRLGVVVLDEVHYLQDHYRGPVWEEVIIQLPTEVQLVCLSATVSNANELAGWIAEVRGSCVPVTEADRPVQLHEHFLICESSAQSATAVPTPKSSATWPKRVAEATREIAAARVRGRDARGASRSCTTSTSAAACRPSSSSSLVRAATTPCDRASRAASTTSTGARSSGWK